MNADETRPLHQQQGAIPATVTPTAAVPVPIPAAGPYSQPVSPLHHQAVVAPRPAVGDAHVAIAWVFAVLSFGYFLPWAIAATRRLPNAWAVGLLNFLLGWTFIGWVVALVMACAGQAQPVQIQVVQHVTTHVAPPGYYPDAAGQPRWWDGSRWH
jgi:hypothetical protein